ncbi:hypothetical protein LCGC14_2695740 [marine sediment metagenome]|uniref:Uncharacterized protein n=1 Tax=marine sediment metagenome TaxID=412755 RepID=A0A0F8ZHA0_9ZZZZ
MIKYHHFQIETIGRIIHVYGSNLLICRIDIDLFGVIFTDVALDIADLSLIRKLMIDVENKQFEIPISDERPT